LSRDVCEQNLTRWRVNANRRHHAYRGIFVVNRINIWQARHDKTPDILETEVGSEIPKNVPIFHAIIWLVVGIILLPVSASWMVDEAVGITTF